MKNIFALKTSKGIVFVESNQSKITNKFLQKISNQVKEKIPSFYEDLRSESFLYAVTGMLPTELNLKNELMRVEVDEHNQLFVSNGCYRLIYSNTHIMLQIPTKKLISIIKLN